MILNVTYPDHLELEMVRAKEGVEYELYHEGDYIGKAIRIHDHFDFYPVQPLNKIYVDFKLD